MIIVWTLFSVLQPQILFYPYTHYFIIHLGRHGFPQALYPFYSKLPLWVFKSSLFSGLDSSMVNCLGNWLFLLDLFCELQYLFGILSQLSKIFDNCSLILVVFFYVFLFYFSLFFLHWRRLVFIQAKYLRRFGFLSFRDWPKSRFVCFLHWAFSLFLCPTLY